MMRLPMNFKGMWLMTKATKSFTLKVARCATKAPVRCLNLYELSDFNDYIQLTQCSTKLTHGNKINASV